MIARTSSSKKPESSVSAPPKQGAFGTLQRQAINGAQMGFAPPIVHDVLRSPGQPMDPATRAFFEPRFGHNFGDVRLHTDARAAESAHAVSAHAYTVGQDIVFGRAQYSPGTALGNKLLAHELTHVVQQSRQGPSASENDLEVEASQAGSAMVAAGSARIRSTAAPGSMYFERVSVHGREFEVGDIRLNRRAAEDVRKHGVLLPGADQGHIAVTGDNRLGYEAAYSTPQDPFRWQHLKDIVDSGHVDIFAVDFSTSFKVKEVSSKGTNVVSHSLVEISLGAEAITLPRISTQKSIEPNAGFYVASADDSRDQIYYDASGGDGKALLGDNALAHEFYGHLWLSTKGVPFQHGREIAADQGVLDPLGRPYAGSVNDYINHYAGESHTALHSPTQGVSIAQQQQTLDWLLTRGAKGLQRLPRDRYKVSSEFGTNWERLGGLYSILKSQHESETEPAGPSAPAVVKTAAGMRAKVVEWYKSLNADGQWVFDSFISSLTEDWFSSPQDRRTELAKDIAPLLKT